MQKFIEDSINFESVSQLQNLLYFFIIVPYKSNVRFISLLNIFQD